MTQKHARKEQDLAMREVNDGGYWETLAIIAFIARLQDRNLYRI